MDELSFEYFEKLWEYGDGGVMTHALSVNHMPGSKAFTVKFLGISDARYRVEPKNRPSNSSNDFIKKGDLIEVQNSEDKKVYKGRYVSGKTNDKGDFIEIKFIDDETNDLIELKPSNVKDV